jgi:hypothetical protein
MVALYDSPHIQFAVHMIAQLCPSLRVLKLRGCERVTAASIIAVAGSCQQLEVLNLHGCTSINDAAASALADGCQRLRSINMNLTAITAVGLNALLDLPHVASLKVCPTEQLTRGAIELARELHTEVTGLIATIEPQGDDAGRHGDFLQVQIYDDNAEAHDRVRQS